MDFYFERYLKEKYPELANWSKTPLDVRVEIYELLSDRGRAWVQINLMNRPDRAEEIWNRRECDNLLHHRCPDCDSIPEGVGVGLPLVCTSAQCPTIVNAWEPENAHPWMGHNHVSPSDASCGDLRWDSWDN